MLIRQHHGQIQSHKSATPPDKIDALRPDTPFSLYNRALITLSSFFRT